MAAELPPQSRARGQLLPTDSATCVGQRHLPEQLPGGQKLERPREAGPASSGSGNRRVSLRMRWDLPPGRQESTGTGPGVPGGASEATQSIWPRTGQPGAGDASGWPAQLPRNDKHLLFRDAEFCNPVSRRECQLILAEPDRWRRISAAVFHRCSQMLSRTQVCHPEACAAPPSGLRVTPSRRTAPCGALADAPFFWLSVLRFREPRWC